MSGIIVNRMFSTVSRCSPLSNVYRTCQPCSPHILMSNRVIPMYRYSPFYTTAVAQLNSNAIREPSAAVKSAVSRNREDEAGNVTPSKSTLRVMAENRLAQTTAKDQAAKIHDDSYLLPHPLWEGEYVNGVTQTHHPENSLLDTAANTLIRIIRFNFDWMSGYAFGKVTKRKVLVRVIFLESIAAVPGSIGGTLRHLLSLRRMQRDGGWIHTLLEEAENERMHLLTFIQLYNPGSYMRAMVFLSQGLFFNFFWVAYMISPRFCHRLVGYLEEQAVKTYTDILNEIDNGGLKEWQTERAPQIAINYWKMPQDATIRDMFAVIRADESHHRDVNHMFGDMKSTDLNPFRAGI